ncbi:MAG: SDR family oxidoreductase [Geminicoccaceae bacterium]|nr:MAG: SDR family oxidoreductase [Geminicoccaceae bacterium]
MTTALVTGGAVRVGRAFVEALAADGYAVAIHCHGSTEAGENLAARLRADGAEVAVVRADLADDNAVRTLVGEAAARLGPVTTLVNSASIFEPDTSADLDPASFRRQLGINLLAPLLLTRELRAQLPSDSVGNVVNVLDQKVEAPLPDYLSYTLSKTGLATATRLLAIEQAPRMRVNAIAPGLTLPSGAQSQAAFEAVHAQTPLERGNTTADLVHALRYLLAAPAVTGQILYVDGGQRLEPRYTDPTITGHVRSPA